MRLLAATFAVFSALASPALAAGPSHALAMHGEPALPADFQHFPYVNPDAPKGGRVDYAWQGSFDSVNPFIVQGDAARGLADLELGNNVFETLMHRSADEPFTLYPLIAKTVETDDQRTFVEFTLDERARFSDGEPIKPEDVIFTIELLRDKGFPRYATTANKVASIKKVGERGVRFEFAEPDRELPLILGLMPVLPKHATDAENFDRSTLKPMVGSGPYLIANIRPGESITLKRNPDYWAKDIPTKVGHDNYDEIRINYIRDDNTIFEAFKKGSTSINIETDTGRWTTGYDFPAARQGRVIKDEFPKRSPSGMYGFVMNTRRPVFGNRDVRHALSGLFDFEWANRNLFNGAYARIRSFYDGSELSSFERHASQEEKALLADFPDAVLPEIMEGTWQLPVSDGSGRDRNFLRKGMDALKAAGYRLEGSRLVDAEGKPLSFEIMLNGPSAVPVATAWSRTLERLGISAQIRVVDAAQYLQRQRVYDFDVMLFNYTSSLSPGVEQVFRWGSANRDRDGTYNFAGVAEPAIDAMIDQLLSARTKEEFVTAVRAYDRVLLSGAYVVPLYHQPVRWIARWEQIQRPEVTPLLGPQLTTWWHAGK
ncbi:MULTISPECIES: extracellular solute-binding protein [unclassified Aminobacter]|uniref:extracellular solute-binding protein n=1 Tax=unclassified Aminobacter TaxID=2644704 RepID=UPI000464FC8F|nr:MULTISPECIES: extracellular solute-binding protein [unclassified Aminobacter]TWH33600.1 peptide/nickel transport system substrate-binding protein [Aminobacter sp. J15]